MHLHHLQGIIILYPERINAPGQTQTTTCHTREECTCILLHCNECIGFVRCCNVLFDVFLTVHHAVRSPPTYCTAAYRGWRYQRLWWYNWSSWGWTACSSKHVEVRSV